MKLNLALYSILGLLIASPANAQTCIPQWCGAGWPPPSGSDNTAGKDNCGAVCVKMGSTTGYTVIFNKGANTFHNEIDADMIVVAEKYLIFKKGGKEVARFDSQHVIGWKAN